MMDAACCATVDIKIFSLLMDTSLYPVTLAWAIPSGQLESLQAPFHCIVTLTGLRTHVTLFGEIEAIIRELTVTSGIDRVTIHEMLLGLSSDMSGRNCLLMLGFLERERDGYGSMS